MNSLNSKSQRAKQYLLGTLAPADKSRFEEDYFTDHELFEEMEIVEDELVDAYIRKQLSKDDLSNFETNLTGSSRLKQKVEFARTLAKSTSSLGLLVIDPAASDPKESFWRRFLFPNSTRPRFALALLSLALLLVLGSGALFFAWMRLRTAHRQLESERAELQQRNQILGVESEKQKSELVAQLDQARAENARLLEELESKRDQPLQSQEKTVTFLLFSGALRSTGRRNLVAISPQTVNVRLRLALPAEAYSSYSASIKTAEQTQILNKAQLKPQTARHGKIVVLLLSGSQLQPGTYIVELTGLNASGNPEPLSDYTFQVVRKRN